MTEDVRLGIALGGGGSRAFVHLGVLARLEEEGLRPHCVSGSSMGAVLGALYAADPVAQRSIPRILEYFRKSPLFGSLIRQDKGDGLHARPGFIGTLARKAATASIAGVVSFRLGLRKMNPVVRAIDEFFAKNQTRIEDLALPFAVNSLNLTRGRLEDHLSGPLAPALKAGVAIGLVFAPFSWNGCQHADAAPIAPVPVTLCRRLGADRVVAVDICAPIKRPLDAYSGFDVVRRIMSMQSEVLNESETAAADVLLKIDASDVFWGDFSRIDDLVERGREAAGSIVGRLRESVSS
ncbi:MAG: patatin-like phospholipase family protein [Planctomycetota bacterium]|nr:patatin-like phospholipase family protein [Planctomycetota bacterium]